MAKVPFTKLKCKLNIEEVSVPFGEENIVIKQYLPIQDKLELIGEIIMQAHEQDENYSNPVKSDVFIELGIVFSYTNISFTDKQKEDLPKLYDILQTSGVIKLVMDNIPAKEIDTIYSGVWRSTDSIYKYQNSVLGILDTIKADYADLDFDAEELKEKIANPENLDLLKNVLTKLG